MRPPNLQEYQEIGEFFSEADAVVILSALIKYHGICLEEIMAFHRHS